VTRRKCGECRECCIAMDVKAMNSVAGKPCEKLCAKGCSIYDSRPTECRTFTCAWLDGIIPLWMKPSKIHAVLWGTELGPEHGEQIPMLRVSLNPAFKINKRLAKWMKTRRVVATAGQRHRLMIAGENHGTWLTGDQIEVKVTDNQIAEITVV
jgi:hypothetical protein